MRALLVLAAAGAVAGCGGVRHATLPQIESCLRAHGAGVRAVPERLTIGPRLGIGRIRTITFGFAVQAGAGRHTSFSGELPGQVALAPSALDASRLAAAARARDAQSKIAAHGALVVVTATARQARVAQACVR
jgi:hypothetical protein